MKVKLKRGLFDVFEETYSHREHFRPGGILFDYRMKGLAHICHYGFESLKEDSPLDEKSKIEMYFKISGILKHFLGYGGYYDGRNYRKLENIRQQLNAAYSENHKKSKKTKKLERKWDF